MLKIKLVDNQYCPTPFCDECGREIEGPEKHDPGAYIYFARDHENTKDAVFELFLVHKDNAKNGDRCMDRIERRYGAKPFTDNSPTMGWLNLDDLPVYMFNNPGFRSERKDEKYRIVKGMLRCSATDSGI